MKARRSNPSLAPVSNETALYQAILALRSDAECRRFFQDLCTPAELEALTDRWAVVAYLRDGLPYRRIHELTGVSVTTIGRVARCLTAEDSGYRAVLERLQPLQRAKQ
jgi:TrpR-related protein YerC/YecD